MLVEGTAVPADPGRGLAMLELACEGKDMYACFTAGLLHEEGRGGAPRDPQRAATAFGRACELGHATGCYNAGILLYRELGARPGENEQAVGYFERACEGAQPAGCLRVGLAALRGVGAAEDRARAAGLFDRACQGGDHDGCHAAEQLKKARGRRVEIALTTQTPSFSIGGLSVRDLSCRMTQTDPMALAEAVEGLAAHKQELDACAPAGEAAAVAWSYRGGKTGDVRVRGMDAKIASCVRKAVERARSSLTASCAATLLIGEPGGARRVYAERRSQGPGAPATAAR
jgi:TPR repeat protein